LARDDDDDNVGDYDDDNMTIDMMTLLTVNQSLCGHIIMAALHSRCRHYILQLWFLSSFSPILSGQRLDVYHTCTHDEAYYYS